MKKPMGYSLLLLVLLAAPMGCGGGDKARCERKAGGICTIAGTGTAGLGDENLPATETELYLPQDVTIGPDGLPYIVDWNNHRIRAIDALGMTHTLIGTGYLGDAPPGVATETNLNHPTHVAFTPTGDLILSAWHNSKVMRYNFTTKLLEVICGTGMRAFNGDGVPGPMTAFNLPVATVIAPDGQILISDQANQRIRSLTAGVDAMGAPTTAVVTRVGTGMMGPAADGPAISATLNMPVGQSAAPAGRIAMNAQGVLFIADTGNHVIRRVDLDGNITTIAGTGAAGNGAAGPATTVALNTPNDVEVDAAGNVYIADTMNSCVRRRDVAGNMTTVAGICGMSGIGKLAGDGGPAGKALLDRPYGITLDATGNLFIADTHHHVIRIVYAPF